MGASSRALTGKSSRGRASEGREIASEVVMVFSGRGKSIRQQRWDSIYCLSLKTEMIFNQTQFEYGLHVHGKIVGVLSI